ncbi:MAG TPA: lysophospholipid acyltransferase family protein [Deltaproteobacteria bacterium]|jgi:hypothetical protein|nr:lysophospholipid acyltransferase family protein [Deltaproteobacteria bacterium]HQI00703.1 lysophospholipid acyltransferase family protein [Deltaproteobacteria bacterium]HQJ09590.1 lysophospholipid acyltransferase family protein [Deltaproteobacteria bacterium]
MPYRSPNHLNFWEKLMLKTFPPLIAFLIRNWCRTCRVVARINEENERNAVIACNGAVYVSWHQRMFYFFKDFGNRNIIMMISRSKDGDYANDVALRLGFSSVRGSKGKGGHKAMYKLIEKLNEGGRTAGIMVDGPKGPPRVLKMGAIKIAEDTGKPIIPMMYGAEHRIVLKSWDRYFLPVPFTRIVVYHGNPIFVPRGATREEARRIRLEVERVLNEMADVCDTFWGGNPVGKPGYDLVAADTREEIGYFSNPSSSGEGLINNS